MLSKDLLATLGEHSSVFEAAENDRIKCTLTGHELPNDVDKVMLYVRSNGFQRKFAKHAIDWKAHYPFLHPVDDRPRQLYCELTNRLVACDATAVARHLDGKFYKRRLDKYNRNPNSFKSICQLLGRPVVEEQSEDMEEDADNDEDDEDVGDELGIWIPDDVAEDEEEEEDDDDDDDSAAEEIDDEEDEEDDKDDEKVDEADQLAQPEENEAGEQMEVDGSDDDDLYIRSAPVKVRKAEKKRVLKTGLLKKSQKGYVDPSSIAFDPAPFVAKVISPSNSQKETHKPKRKTKLGDEKHDSKKREAAAAPAQQRKKPRKH